MEITWFGNASILIKAAGETILFDPFVQLRGGENPNSLADFAQAPYICITHGHLDHMMEVPEFLDRAGELEATVYCGSVTARTLEEQGVDGSNAVQVGPGMSWNIGDVTLQVLKGSHSRGRNRWFWKALTDGRLFAHFWNILFWTSAEKQFPEGDETLIYELLAEGKRVQVLGSLALDPGEAYEPGADLLILPLEATSHPEEKAMAIVEQLKPKAILLDHFDDAYPPVSRSVDTGRFRKLMEEKYPQIVVVKTQVGTTVIL